MALQKSVQDVVLSSGLNLRVDPNLAAPNNLIQADDVQYTRQGALSKRYGFNTNLGSSGANAAIFTTKEGNIGYTNATNSGRTLASTVGNPSVNPMDGHTAALLFPAGTKQLLTVQNYTSAELTGQPGVFLMSWEYYAGGGTNNVSTTYAGVWNANTKSWIVLPYQFPVGGTFTISGPYTVTVTGFASPMSLPNGIVAGFLEYQYTDSVPVLHTVTQLCFATPGSAPSTWPRHSTCLYDNQSTAAYYGYRTSMSCSPSTVGTTGKVAFAVAPGNFPTHQTATLVLVDSSGNPTNLGTLASSMGNATNYYKVAVNVDTSTGNVCITDGAQYQVVSQTGATVVAATAYTTPFGASVGHIALGLAANGFFAIGLLNNNNWVYTDWSTIGGSTLSSVTVTSVTGNGGTVGIQSAPFTDGTTQTPYAWMLVNNSVAGYPQATYLMVNLLTGAVVGRAGYQAAPADIYLNPVNVTAPAGAYGSCFLTLGSLPLVSSIVNGTIATAGTPIYSPQFTYLAYQFGGAMAIEMPTGTMVAGLAPVYLTDGDGYEMGFSYFPQTYTSLFTVTSGGNVTGTVQYAVAYQWVDSYNQIHWSNYTPVTINAGTGSTVAIPVVNFPADKGALFWFRTTAGGTVFYQLTANQANGFTFTDNVSDAQLTANGAVYIYTTGGELQNDPPPATSIIAATSTRAFAVSAENPSLLYYSKPFRVGHPPEWSALLSIYVGGTTGPVTALAVLDDKLVIFKETSVAVLLGNGPDVAGQNSDYQLQPVTTYGGAINQNSTVVTDQGIFFQSPRGISLLDRSLQEQFIGQPLDGHVQNIVDATSVPALSQVRFCDLGAQCTWVYDTMSQAWTRFTNWGGSITAGTGLATIVTGGYIWQESAASFIDFGSTLYVPQVTTAWLKTSGMQGFARLYRVALLGNIVNYGTDQGHGSVGIAYDYKPGVVDTLYLGTYASIPPPPPPYTAPTSMHWRSRVPRQQMEATQYTITWPTTATDSFYLTAISLEIGVKLGVGKLPASQSV